MDSPRGFASAHDPLWDAIFGRRSRRVAAGATSAPAALSFQSKLDPQPLSRLEEAYLIAATGVTGLPYWDNPYETADGKPLLGTPCVEGSGRAAGSPDNAQSTVFFMWNDEGTYMLKRPDGPAPQRERAHDVGRRPHRACRAMQGQDQGWPARVSPRLPSLRGRQQYVSNVPGSTMFMPVTEVTRQYINGLFYVLAQEPGRRPVFLDDFNNWLPCGCERWVKSKFLNKEIPIPLSFYAKGRTEYEVDAAPAEPGARRAEHGPWRLDSCRLREHDPARWLSRHRARPGFPIRAAEEAPHLRGRTRRPTPNPVGLDGVLQSYAPPYFKDTDAAIDAILAEKYGPSGLYRRPAQRRAEHEARGRGRIHSRVAARRAGGRRSRACDLPVHLEDLPAVSGALPRHRFSRHLDAMPPHRSRVLRALLHGGVLADAGRPRGGVARERLARQAPSRGPERG